MSVELEVMVVAWIRMPEAYAFRPETGNPLLRIGAAFRPGAEMLRSPCLAYVIRHPSASPILVDTGIHPDAEQSLRDDFGLRMWLLFRGLRPAAVPYVEQLRAAGVDADQVERVVMTHLHVDHTGGMRLLPRARFVCSSAEWRSATGSGAGGRGYVAHHLPDESRMELIDFDVDGEATAPFSSTIDLLGDGSIRLISTPGHTHGHMSVLVQTADRGPVLIVGDAAYTVRSIREQILPLLTGDDDTYRRSLRELKAFTDLHPDAPVVPTHDPTAWKALQSQAAPA